MERTLEENKTLQELTVIIGTGSAELHYLLEPVFANPLQTLSLKGDIGEYVDIYSFSRH